MNAVACARMTVSSELQYNNICRSDQIRSKEFCFVFFFKKNCFFIIPPDKNREIRGHRDQTGAFGSWIRTVVRWGTKGPKSS